MIGSRKGSVDPPGTGPGTAPGTAPGAAPGNGVGDGVCAGIVPGGAVGFVGCVPGGAAGFCVGVVVPGIGSCPGGLVGLPGTGVGRGVDCGVCASAALLPANTMHDSTTDLTKVRDIKLNIRRRAP